MLTQLNKKDHWKFGCNIVSFLGLCVGRVMITMVTCIGLLPTSFILINEHN